jgi:hypothetical protein
MNAAMFTTMMSTLTGTILYCTFGTSGSTSSGTSEPLQIRRDPLVRHVDALFTPEQTLETAVDAGTPLITADMTEGEVTDLLGPPLAALEADGTSVWRYARGVAVFAGGRVLEWTSGADRPERVTVRDPMLSGTQRVGEPLPKSARSKVWAPPGKERTRSTLGRNDRWYLYGRTPFSRARRNYLPSEQQQYRNRNRAQLTTRWLYRATRHYGNSRYDDNRFVRADQRRRDLLLESDRYRNRLRGTPRLTRELRYRFRPVLPGEVRGR